MAEAIRQPVIRPFPRGPLFGAIALIGFSIAAVVFGEVTEIGTLRNPTTAPLEIRDIVFAEGPGEIVTVTDAHSGAVVRTIPAGQDNFIRGALRGLNRDRLPRQVTPDTPYRLILWDDGRLTLSDTGTGHRVLLDAFGATNAAAFAKLLDNRSPTP